MNADELAASLARQAADPEAVMVMFHGKREAMRLKAERHRPRVVRGLLLVAVTVLVVLAVQHLPRPASSAQSDGCAVVSLPETLSMARQGGASIITGKGTVTGRTVTDGEVYYEMKLDSVRTLSGPTIEGRSIGWVGSRHSSAGPLPGTDPGPLWGTDGSLFAIAWPAQAAGTTVGPVLRVAPVVNDQVVFSAAGCWDATGTDSLPFDGPLAGIPQSDAYRRAALGGFHAVPLATVESLAVK